MANKQYWYTQEVLGLVEHFGKLYFYLKDVDGHIYLAKAKPIYNTASVDGANGEVTPVLTGYEPDLT
jgi:hypothetical protein